MKIFLALPVGVRLRLELGGERCVLLVQLPQLLPRLVQGFGSGSGLNPDSIRSVHPDPGPYSESGSRRAKMTHKSTKKLRNFMF